MALLLHHPSAVPAQANGLSLKLAPTGATPVDALPELESCVSACHELLSSLFPDSTLTRIKSQGGCSLTFLRTASYGHTTVSHSHHATSIIQCRLRQYSIPVSIADQAYSIYSPYAPRIRGLQPVAWVDPVRYLNVALSVPFQIVEMDRLTGVTASEIMHRLATPRLPEQTRKMKQFLSSLATFLSLGWKHAQNGARCTGRVGSTILNRLKMLEFDLPSTSLKAFAESIRQEVQVGALEGLPIVLTHGDFIPSNLLVDNRTWRLTGVVDWAEAEYLPFGMALYGIEHLLGGLNAIGDTFEWIDDAEELRLYFWSCLAAEIPALKDDSVRCQVLLAKAVGILLWRGIAWDDGKIDRVVNAVDDVADLAYLEAFVAVVDCESSLVRPKMDSTWL